MSRSIVAVLKGLILFLKNEMLFPFHPKSNIGFWGKKKEKQTKHYRKLKGKM